MIEAGAGGVALNVLIAGKVVLQMLGLDFSLHFLFLGEIYWNLCSVYEES